MKWLTPLYQLYSTATKQREVKENQTPKIMKEMILATYLQRNG